MSTENEAMRTVPEQTHAFGKEVTGSSFILEFRGGWKSVVASEGFAKWIEYAVIERL